MHDALEDIVNRADALFYAMAALADPTRREEREAIEDAFDALYAEAMRLGARIRD
ncbi:hypothetical protein [uncultured Alistipes sp.]|uniref:hypothetical protein n=1 Tax=uncultured Alistipes sp. TaxID=538949 RepID=UPI00272D438C|nr:hypothetical protein [uncultured Alistipes sp.]